MVHVLLRGRSGLKTWAGLPSVGTTRIGPSFSNAVPTPSGTTPPGLPLPPSLNPPANGASVASVRSAQCSRRTRSGDGVSPHASRPASEQIRCTVPVAACPMPRQWALCSFGGTPFWTGDFATNLRWIPDSGTYHITTTKHTTPATQAGSPPPPPPAPPRHKNPRHFDTSP